MAKAIVMRPKFHLFFSAKQAAEQDSDSIYIKRDEQLYRLEDGSIVEATEAIPISKSEEVPTSSWDDASYLGIGTFHITLWYGPPHF